MIKMCLGKGIVTKLFKKYEKEFNFDFISIVADCRLRKGAACGPCRPKRI